MLCVLQEPPKPEPPQKDHAEYYGKGFRGKSTKSKRKTAAKEPPAAKTLAEKKQVLIEEVSQSSDSESSEVDIEVKVEDFDTPDSLNNKGSADRSDGSRPSEPQPMKLLPPPRPGMQPVDVRSSRRSCSSTRRAVLEHPQQVLAARHLYVQMSRNRDLLAIFQYARVPLNNLTG